MLVAPQESEKETDVDEAFLRQASNIALPHGCFKHSVAPWLSSGLCWKLLNESKLNGRRLINLKI